MSTGTEANSMQMQTTQTHGRNAGRRYFTLAGAVTLASASAAFAFAAAPAGMNDSVDAAVTAGTEYGLTHFIEIEFEDRGELEIEGWREDGWYVETEFGDDGSILDEKRERRIDGPWGMPADDVRRYARVAMERGMQRIEEIKIDNSGYVEVEGSNADGHDLEVYFRHGNFEPVNVDEDGNWF